MYVRNSVKTLQQYMDDHPLAYKTLREIWLLRADADRNMLEKAFKQITGYGIKEYLVKVRLEQSKQYLRNGMQIKHVATKSKYKSQSAYCTAFKRHFKRSPTDWLKDEQP
ncbi:hypothetical protein A4H97_22975 [Niastella yeongjuensis]|uniref:HTH araC/xylS-type domain-containing protein n=2 Tax=Niastella yeongjuensis TaxID=354355 RepID=A0A1V9F7X7_9BACT|nr:hypothetical protein A4H97_22975 [Niastella yeongjuensis]SEP29743.1 AraC-type DNA-binding protein [Niastella yeongjuensis]